jgi:hypothetical protein
MDMSVQSGSGLNNSRRIKKNIIQPNANNSAIKHFPKDFFGQQESEHKVLK